MSNSSASIGLVAIGRNEGERLKRCLQSVPLDVPVVYVDSASTDGSVESARSTQATVVELGMANLSLQRVPEMRGLRRCLSIARTSHLCSLSMVIASWNRTGLIAR